VDLVKLTISAEHVEESRKEDKNSGWFRKESKRGQFTRTFNLDDMVDAQKVSRSIEIQ